MPNIPAAGHWRLLYLPYFAATEGWSVQIAVGAVENSGLCWRKAHGAEWQPWEFAATATPPEEIPLKLAEGFANANDVTSVYWKDQFNQVHFFIALLMPQITSTFGVVIATLPEGYRPNKTLLYVCSSMDVSTRRTGSFNVNPDGTIVYYGDLLSPGAILFGSGAFVAAG